MPRPLGKRLTTALWTLATPRRYWPVANPAGSGRSTVGATLGQVGCAIDKVLASQVTTLGNAQEITGGFARMGFPNCVGTADGTHVPVICPPNQGTEFINTKWYFSIACQRRTGRVVWESPCW